VLLIVDYSTADGVAEPEGASPPVQAVIQALGSTISMQSLRISPHHPFMFRIMVVLSHLSPTDIPTLSP
jgi:hypothetical protein